MRIAQLFQKKDPLNHISVKQNS